MSLGAVRTPGAAGPSQVASPGSWDEGALLGSSWSRLPASQGAWLPEDEVGVGEAPGP